MIREKDYIVLTASYGTPHLHKHLALHLLFGLDSRLDCRIEGQSFHKYFICPHRNPRPWPAQIDLSLLFLVQIVPPLDTFR